MYRLETKAPKKTSRRKRKREFFRQTIRRAVHWSCYVLLFTDFVNC